MKYSKLAIWLSIAFILLLSILIAALYIITAIDKKPVHCRSWAKEKKTGLVTVMDKQGNLVCTFYDSIGGINCHCIDTSFTYSLKKK